MQLLSWATLRDFADQRQSFADHRALLAALRAWRNVIEGATWKNFADLKSVYRSADAAGDRVVFDICGNNYRIVARVDYAFQMVLVKFVGTHAEYDSIGANIVAHKPPRKGSLR